MKKFGADIHIARLKRGFTVETMAQRIGIHRSTFSKMEKGDPMVGLGAYATALFVLGFGIPLSDLIDQRSDDTGLLLDLEKLPKRIRPKKKPGTMNRQIKIYLGKTKRFVGTLFFNSSGNRESSRIEIESQSGSSQMKALKSIRDLPLRYGRVFRTRKEGNSVFHGAIADSEPDGWARQVILRDYGKHRKERNDREIPLTMVR